MGMPWGVWSRIGHVGHERGSAERLVIDSMDGWEPRFEGVTVCNVDFVGLDFGRFLSIASEFVDCSFVRCRSDNFVAGGEMKQSFYHDCTFDRCSFTMAVAGVARFENCDFEDVKLSKWSGGATELVDCRFSGVLKGGSWHGRVDDIYRSRIPRTVNEFRGNDFTGMTLKGLDIRDGLDLSLQKWPLDPVYVVVTHAARALAFAEERISNWDDDDERESAEGLVDLFRRFADDQDYDQIFARTDEFGAGSDRVVAERFFALLVEGDKPAGEQREDVDALDDMPSGDDLASSVGTGRGSTLLDVVVEPIDDHVMIFDPSTRDGPDFLTSGDTVVAATAGVVMIRTRGPENGSVRLVVSTEEPHEGMVELHRQVMPTPISEVQVGNVVAGEVFAIGVEPWKAVDLRVFGDAASLPSAIYVHVSGA